MDTLEYVECQRMMARFARALDTGRYEDVAALMAPDGIWHRQGERLEGRAAIRAALERRPPELLTRHLVLNVEIDFDAPDRVIGRSTVLVFRHEGGERPAPMSLPRSVLDYEDTLVKLEGRWLIAERKSQRMFSV